MKKKNLLLSAIIILGIATATIAQVPSYVSSTGLVGWWPFSGNANDQSVNANNGTLTGPVLTTDRFGNSNSAYFFNGTGDYIDVLNSSSLNLIDSASFSFWMLWSGDNSNIDASQSIIDKSTTSDIENYRIAVVEPSGNPANKLGVLSNQVEVNSPSSYNLTQWFHTVVTIKSGVAKIYINGVLDYTGSLNLTSVNTNNLLFGKDIIPTGVRFFFGKLDDIGIWNRSLTHAEITQLYIGANVGINENSEENLFSIFPNPFSSQTILWTAAQLNNATLSVDNCFGQTVTQIKNINGQTVILSRDNLAGGLYFVHLTQDNKVIATKKLLITD